MRKLRTCLALLAGLAALPTSSLAAGLFGWPGNVDLPPQGRAYDGAVRVLLQDDQGAVYLSDRKCQVAAGDPWRSWGGPDKGWVAAPGLDGVTTLVVTDDGGPTETVQILHARCEDLEMGREAGIKVVATFERPRQEGIVSVFRAALPDGSVCQAVAQGLWCARPGPDGVEHGLRLDFTTLDQNLRISPGVLPDDPKYANPMPEYWHIEKVAGLPSGALMAVVVRHSWLAMPDGVKFAQGRWFIVSDAPDQAYALSVGTALDTATSLFYSPELDAMTLFPVLDHDYSHVQVAVKGGDGAGNGVATDLGPRGAALLLIDAGGEGAGHLSLTDAIARRRACNTKSYSGVECQSQLISAHAFPRPGGMGFALPHVSFVDLGKTERETRLYTITYDASTFDLDRDGLSAAEELALGTSDWQWDTDGGGTSDHVEAGLAGTDPDARGDDPWLAFGIPGRSALVQSHLLRGLRGWSFENPHLTRAETWSALGPLCVDNRCFDSDGKLVGTYDAGAVKSADGTYLLLPTDTGWDRLTFADGVREPALDRSLVEALMPPGAGAYPLRLVPVDADTIFAVREGFPARVALFERGQPGRVVFDLQAERCASKLGPCDQHPAGSALNDVPVHDVPHDRLELLGWVPETQRLMLGVLAVWDLYVVGVHATEPSVVVANGSTLGGLPGWVASVGGGVLMSDGGLVDPFFEVRQTWMGIGVPQKNPQLMGAWGDTLMRASGSDLVEVVRYDPGVEPGDVLVLRDYDGATDHGGKMLYVSKPRGGLVPVWGAYEDEMVSVDGIDASADGRVCVADRTGQQLWEYASAPGGVPDQLRVRADVGDIVDCKYDGDGDLHLLFADPPRVEVRYGAWGDSVVETTLDPISVPRQLVRRPDGSFEVLTAADDVRGRLYTRAGRTVEMARDSLTLTVDGTPLATLGKLWWINSQTSLPETYWGDVAPAERADGVLLIGGVNGQPDSMYVMVSRFWAVDPRTGNEGEPWTETHYGMRPLGIAVVPGGLPVDPWSGRLVGDPAPLPPSDFPPPWTPQPPIGGEPDATPDESCQAAGRSGPPQGWWLVGLSVLVLGLRRRALQPRA